MGAPAVAMTDATTTETAFIVELEENGDATVSLTLTYDLADEHDETAFEQLEADTSDAVDRFEHRLSRIASQAAQETDRDMRISAVDTTVRTVDEVGVVHLSVTWSNLAAVEDDRLTVNEPFASGFSTDRPFVLVAPDGYLVSDSAPSASGIGTSSVEWDAGTDLSGFSATMTPSEMSDQESETDDTNPVESTGGSADSLPGPAAPALAIALLGTLAYRVRQRR